MINEIKQALAAATPGPWRWVDPCGLERKKLVGEWEIMNFGIGGVYDQVAGSEPDKDDAHLVANAPTWLQWSVSEIERLQAENERLRKALLSIEEEMSDDTSERAQRINKVIQQALKEGKHDTGRNRTIR